MAKLCEICERREITHICENCGRNICEDCFERDPNLCLECAKGERREGVPKVLPRTITNLGIVLILIGTVLMIIAAMQGATEGFVLVGFFPFLLGFGSFSPLLSLLALIMFLLPLILFTYQWITSRPEQKQRHETAIDEQKEISEHTDSGEQRETREEEEIIAVSIPGYTRKDFPIQILGDKLIIQAKEGKDFYKAYGFPRGIIPIEFSLKYIEDHKLLIIKIKVRREEYPSKDEDF